MFCGLMILNDLLTVDKENNGVLAFS